MAPFSMKPICKEDDMSDKATEYKRKLYPSFLDMQEELYTELAFLTTAFRNRKAPNDPHAWDIFESYVEQTLGAYHRLRWANLLFTNETLMDALRQDRFEDSELSAVLIKAGVIKPLETIDLDDSDDNFGV
jgi:hypothetical protein